MGNSHSGPGPSSGGGAGADAVNSVGQAVGQAAGEALGKVAKDAGAALQSNLQKALNDPGAAYRALVESMHGKKAVGGGRGCGCGYFDGGAAGADEDPADSVKDYRDSRAAEAKDRILRGLARALSKVGIPVDENAGAQAIADALVEKLPDPKKGSTFSSDAESQKKVCESVAQALNDEFTPGVAKKDRLIDTSLKPAGVCRQVVEIAHSLSAGIQTEFLEVHASLTRVVRNLEVLGELLRETHESLGQEIAKGSFPAGGDKKISNLQDVLSRVGREQQRQLLLLKNYLQVTLAPAKEELEFVLKDLALKKKAVDEIDLQLGTGEFADRLADAVSGLGSLAVVASRVDAALKEVGLSVREYLESFDDADQLGAALQDKMVESGGWSLKFRAAAETLKQNFHRRDEIPFSGKDSVGGGAERRGGGHRPGHPPGRRDNVSGGHPFAFDYGGKDDLSTLDRRVKVRKLDRKILVKDFVDQTTRQYDRLLKAIMDLGPLLGKKIPLTSEVERLRNAIARLTRPDLDQLNFDLALIGYRADPASREKKREFLENLRVVKDILDDIMGLEKFRAVSDRFAPIRATIGEIVKTIDFYSDAVTKRLGKGEDVAEVEGGAGDDEDKKLELSALPEVARSAYDLDRSVNSFLYFYYVAKVRENLDQTSKELEFYGEKYADLLGDAVAARLRQLETEKSAVLQSVLGGKDKDSAKSDGVKKKYSFIEKQYSCKAGFYRALQALDLYMKAFTEGVVAHPDEVADIKRCLDGVSVIGRWFVDGTGDSLVNAFDQMPAWDGGKRVEVDNAAVATAQGHYYQKITTPANIDSNKIIKVGIPQLATDIGKASDIEKSVESTYDKFQALKNIMNAFVRVGEKFGGRELRRQVFMSPTQMYKAFMEYLKCSALSIGKSENFFSKQATSTASKQLKTDIDKAVATMGNDDSATINTKVAAAATNTWKYHAQVLRSKVIKDLDDQIESISPGVKNLAANLAATPTVAFTNIKNNIDSSINSLNMQINIETNKDAKTQLKVKLAALTYVKAEIFDVLGKLIAAGHQVDTAGTVASKTQFINYISETVDKLKKFKIYLEKLVGQPGGGFGKVNLYDSAGQPNPDVDIGSKSADGKDNELFFGSAIKGLEGDFCVEDKYFSFCVKAMAAKVMTVIGVYDLFERPSPIYNLTPTRMIIGGAGYESDPEVVPGAAELYFRLPRLVEFYKDLFNWNSGEEEMISLLPEVEGVFSGIIDLVFNQVQGGAEASGNYTDSEIRQIIREVNAIYENFRGAGGENACKEALTALVMEINRRYGLVKKKDWDALQKLLRTNRSDKVEGFEGNTTNYAILPGEEEFEADRRAPSDRYLGVGAGGDLSIKGKHFIDGKKDCDDWARWKMLKDFRKNLDKKFGVVTASDFATFSFSTTIRQGRGEIEKAADPRQKIEIATRLIQGSGNLAGLDVSKTYMFHETVVVGLNVLGAIKTLLHSARSRVQELDVNTIRKNIKDSIFVSGGDETYGGVNTILTAGGAGGAGGAAYAIGDVQGLVNNTGSRRYVRGDAVAKRVAGATDEFTGTNLLDALKRIITAGNAAGATNKVDEAIVEAFTTYIVDEELIMRDLLGVVVGLSTALPGLVIPRFPRTPSGQLQLDFSGMKELVQGLMTDVRSYLDQFRPYMDKEVIKKYESGDAGSLKDFEGSLMDGLIMGPSDDMEKSEDKRAKTVEWMSRTTNEIFRTLVGFKKYSLESFNVAGPAVAAVAGVPAVAAGPTFNNLAAIPNNKTAVQVGALGIIRANAGADHTHNYTQYGYLLSSLIFYDGRRLNSGVATRHKDVATETSNLYGFIRTNSVRTATREYPRSSANNDTTNLISIWNLNGPDLSEDRSMMFMFNQILAKYVSTFFDQASGRIYRPLIDGFANGAFSRAVMTDGHSAPDLSAGDQSFGQRGDPRGLSGVLLQSLALILRRIVVDINPTTQISEHLVSTLSDIPLYLRESFRANLPAYIKMFNMIQAEGDLYKQIMSQTDIKVGRPYGIAAGNYYIDGNANGPVTDSANSGGYSTQLFQNSLTTLRAAPTESQLVQGTLTQIIDAISSGCYSLSGAASEVLRELADEPLYLQTQENSIQDYKARNGAAPLMPISSALTFLENMNAINKYRLFPNYSVGDENFKLMYGTRKLLGRPGSKITLADTPGVQRDLETYNSSAGEREKIDPARYETFLEKVVKGLRFVVDIRGYRSIMSPLAPAAAAGVDNSAMGPFRVNLVGPPGGAAAVPPGIILDPNPNGNSTAVYALSRAVTPRDVLSITESSYQDQETKKITDSVGGGVSKDNLGTDRSREWIYNIIDMNIIPVNVHAMMRGIPFAPLYNYVYTFEQMACSMLGETVGNIEDLSPPSAAAPTSEDIKNTRQMFLKLMIDPYIEVAPEAYGGMAQLHDLQISDRLIERIFRGDDSLMMGRPKFLSDQLYNKALFGSLVPTEYSLDETGPPGAGRMEGYRRPGDMRPVAAAPPAPPAPPTPFARATAGPDSSYLKLGFLKDGTKLEAGPGGVIGFVDVLALATNQGADADGMIRALGIAGKTRFDTRIVRNLFFITNVQRLMRMKLSRELTQHRNVLVESHGIVDAGVTEYGFLPPSSYSDASRAANPAFELSTSRKYDNESRVTA